VVWETDHDSGTTREPPSVPAYLDFRELARRFEALAAFAGAEPDAGRAHPPRGARAS